MGPGRNSEKKWQTEDNLSELRRRTGKKVRILIDDELVYLLTLKVEGGGGQRERVARLAQEVVPEEVMETVWDYKVVERRRDDDLVQFVAINKSYFEDIKMKLRREGWEIESMEPVSYAITRVVEKGNLIIVIMKVDEGFLVEAVRQGVVLMVETLRDLSWQKLEELLVFIKNNFGEKVTKVVVSEKEIAGEVVDGLAKMEIKLEGLKIDPVAATCGKDDLRGSDSQVLNLDIFGWTKPKEEKVRAVTAEDREEKKVKKKISVANQIVKFIVAALLVGVAGWQIVGYIDKTKKEEKKRQEAMVVKPTVTLSPTVTVAVGSSEVTPTESANQKYQIKILNGSGRKGEAGGLKIKFEAAGLKVGETGNYADGSDKTQIRYNQADMTEDLNSFLKQVRRVLRDQNYEIDEKVDDAILISTVLVVIGNK